MPLSRMSPERAPRGREKGGSAGGRGLGLLPCCGAGTIRLTAGAWRGGGGQPAPSIPPRPPARPAFTTIARITTGRQKPQPPRTRTEPYFRAPRDARPGDMWLSGIGSGGRGEGSAVLTSCGKRAAWQAADVMPSMARICVASCQLRWYHGGWAGVPAHPGPARPVAPRRVWPPQARSCAPA